MNISAEKAWQNGRNSTGTFYAPALLIKRQEDLQEDITYQVGGEIITRMRCWKYFNATILLTAGRRTCPQHLYFLQAEGCDTTIKSCHAGEGIKWYILQLRIKYHSLFKCSYNFSLSFDYKLFIAF